MVGFVALTIVAWTVGGPMIRTLRLDGVERVTVRLWLGLGASAVAIMVVGSVSLLAVRWLMGLAAAVVVLLWIAQRAGGRDDGGEPSLFQRPGLDRFGSLCLGAVIAVNALTLLSALAPITSWDAVAAHLAVPKAYTLAGRMMLLEGNAYSAYPQLAHALYTYLYAESGERAVAVLSWGMSVLACASVYALGKRVDSVRSGAIAAALFATAPMYLTQAGTVAIDVPFSGIVAAALALTAAWHRERRLPLLIVAAALAGTACGIRHTGYLVVALIAVGVLFQGGGQRVRNALAFLGVAALASAPWWLRSLMLTGNPVYPVLAGVFGYGPLPDSQVTGILQHETAHGFGVLDFATFPWRIAMQPFSFDGWTASPGGIVVALGFAGIIVGGAWGWRLGVFSLGGIAALYMVQRLARYLFPFFMPLYVTSALAAGRLKMLRRPIQGLIMFSLGYGLLLGAASMHFKSAAALGLESPGHYLARRVERYEAFQWANAHLPKDAGVVLTLDPRVYFLDFPAYQNLAGLRPLAGMSLEEQRKWMRVREIRYLFIPERYVDSSPIFKAYGLLPVVDAWLANPARFKPVYDRVVADPRGGAGERVVILEVV